MTSRTSWLRVIAVKATVLAVAAGCMNFAGPSDLAFVGFTPVFMKEEAETYRDLSSFDMIVDNVHLQLKHENGAMAVDTVIAIAPGQDSVVIDVSVRLDRPQELLQATLMLRDGDVPLFAGTEDIPVKRGGDLASRPPPIQMTYLGPGALAHTLIVGPADTTITASDSVVFRPLAMDAGGQPLSGVVVAWLLSDATRGTISSTGVFTPSGGKGSTYVIGRLPTGLRDSTLVEFVPKLTSGGSGGKLTSGTGT